MKRIKVYADFDFLVSPQEIGTLGYERFPAHPKRLDALTSIRHKPRNKDTPMSADRPIYRAVGCKHSAPRLGKLYA